MNVGKFQGDPNNDLIIDVQASLDTEVDMHNSHQHSHQPQHHQPQSQTQLQPQPKHQWTGQPQPQTHHQPSPTVGAEPRRVEAEFVDLNTFSAVGDLEEIAAAEGYDTTDMSRDDLEKIARWVHSQRYHQAKEEKNRDKTVKTKYSSVSEEELKAAAQTEGYDTTDMDREALEKIAEWINSETYLEQKRKQDEEDKIKTKWSSTTTADLKAMVIIEGYDVANLERQQLEKIAEWVQGQKRGKDMKRPQEKPKQPKPNPKYASTTIEELQAIAHDKGYDTSGLERHDLEKIADWVETQDHQKNPKDTESMFSSTSTGELQAIASAQGYDIAALGRKDLEKIAEWVHTQNLQPQSQSQSKEVSSAFDSVSIDELKNIALDKGYDTTGLDRAALEKIAHWAQTQPHQTPQNGSPSHTQSIPFATSVTATNEVSHAAGGKEASIGANVGVAGIPQNLKSNENKHNHSFQQQLQQPQQPQQRHQQIQPQPQPQQQLQQQHSQIQPQPQPQQQNQIPQQQLQQQLGSNHEQSNSPADESVDEQKTHLEQQLQQLEHQQELRRLQQIHQQEMYQQQLKHEEELRQQQLIHQQTLYTQKMHQGRSEAEQKKSRHPYYAKEKVHEESGQEQMHYLEHAQQREQQHQQKHEVIIKPRDPRHIIPDEDQYVRKRYSNNVNSIPKSPRIDVAYGSQSPEENGANGMKTSQHGGTGINVNMMNTKTVTTTKTELRPKVRNMKATYDVNQSLNDVRAKQKATTLKSMQGVWNI